MCARTLGLGIGIAVLGACATAPSSSRFERRSPADPERFERIACLRGELPLEFDGNAFAKARALDLAAERQGQASPEATRRLLERREAFEARCAAWQAAARPADRAATGRGIVYVKARTSR